MIYPSQMDTYSADYSGIKTSTRNTTKLCAAFDVVATNKGSVRNRARDRLHLHSWPAAHLYITL